MALYEFTLIGKTAILIHADDVEAADMLVDWRKNPANKNASVPGDDRSPAWTWQTYLYHDGTHLTVPADNLMVALRKAGADMKLKGQKTFKALTQTAILPEAEHFPILVGGKPVPLAAVQEIADDATFRQHAEAVKPLGFTLFVKRAKVGQSKHVRVRPRFDEWSIKGVLRTTSDAINEDALRQLLEIAGNEAGLCDWRPSSPKSPGSFGRFDATLKKTK